jgi:hypothetical protein
MAELYYVTKDDIERQVTKAEFVRVERAAGFRNTNGQPGEPATAGFSNGPLRGRVDYAPSQARIFCWRWKAQAPIGDIAAEVTRISDTGHRVFMREYADGSDQYMCVVSNYEVDDAEAERIDEAGTISIADLGREG